MQKNLPNKIELNNSSKKYAYNNNFYIMIQRYDDKKQIFFPLNIKMNAIEIKNEYNEKNRRADKFNQHISYYNCKRKSINIGSKFFFWN